LGDVLEHLISPVNTIKKLLNVLKPGGRILITVPNIRYWKVILDLIINDKWEYTSWGILDYTHLRFFTKKSIVDLMKSNNFNVIDSQWIIQKPSKSHLINTLSFKIFNGFLASHCFITLQK
jgi:2-polyprenyl-3-methyl-5-hydroxy-6-metoxy-1,4-benzoquinol methylase